MIKWLKWTVLVVVAGLLLADLVVLNVYVLRMRQQLSPQSPGNMTYAELYAEIFGDLGSFYAFPCDIPQCWEWSATRQSCVSDRPDLTGIVDPSASPWYTSKSRTTSRRVVLKSATRATWSFPYAASSPSTGGRFLAAACLSGSST